MDSFPFFVRGKKEIVLHSERFSFSVSRDF